MKADIVRTHVDVRRKPGDKRARTEAHFWGMLRDQLNEDYQGESTHVWVLTRPEKYAMTSMPFALARGRNREEMIIDQDYAIRQPHKQYNAGETVRLDRMRAT